MVNERYTAEKALEILLNYNENDTDSESEEMPGELLQQLYGNDIADAGSPQLNDEESDSNQLHLFSDWFQSVTK